MHTGKLRLRDCLAHPLELPAPDMELRNMVDRIASRSRQLLKPTVQTTSVAMVPTLAADAGLLGLLVQENAFRFQDVAAGRLRWLPLAAAGRRRAAVGHRSLPARGPARRGGHRRIRAVPGPVVQRVGEPAGGGPNPARLSASDTSFNAKISISWCRGCACNSRWMAALSSSLVTSTHNGVFVSICFANTTCASGNC